MTRTTIGNAAAELLIEHRALAAEELGWRIAASGATRARNPTQAVSRALHADRRFRRLTDGRWTMPADLLRGSALAHRLSEGELRSHALALAPDLAPLCALAPGPLLTPDGRKLTFLWDDDALASTDQTADAALQGPEGWLPAVRSGQLVQVRVTGGLVHVERGDKPATESRLAIRRLVESARTRLADLAKTNFPPLPLVVDIESLVLDRLVDDPALIAAPLPPLGEALAASGLEVHRGWIGLPGTSWDDVDELMAIEPDEDDDDWLDDDIDDSVDDRAADRAFDEAMVEMFGLAQREAEGLRILLGAYGLSRRLGGFDRPETYVTLAKLLVLPGIARSLAVMARSDPDLEGFVAAIAGAATGALAAGPRFVLAACAEARDDVATAENLLRSALDADPSSILARVETARYDTDRGEYADALQHLRAAGVPATDRDRAWLEALVRPSLPNVGRNDACPCGSGRKYKACHLGSPGELAPVNHAHVLLHKLDAWLSQPELQRIGQEVVEEAGVPLADRNDGEARDDGHSRVDPLVPDIVLFDRGALQRFLDVRGSLLPATERALGASWLERRRSLYEVQAAVPGSHLLLRDLVDPGETVRLADPSLSRQARTLDLLCLRLLPDGAGGSVVTDGLLVPRSQRARILDLLASADGLALLRWVARPAPPTRLANMEGEELRLVTVAYRISNRAAVARALGAKLRDDGDGRFTETIVRRGTEWIRGSISLQGDRATIEANSKRRANRLERTLLRIDPSARLMRREERAVEGTVGELEGDGSPVDPIDVTAHPEAARAMDEFIRTYEANWVDESVPALGGLTPRAAAAHPTARRELEALLDDMTWQRRRSPAPGGHAATMDPARIRALLSIPERND